ELRELLVLGHGLEEVLHGGPALARPEHGKILGSADRLPIDVGRHRADNGVDAAVLEGGVEAFDEADVGVGHGVLRFCDTPDTSPRPPAVSRSQDCYAGSRAADRAPFGRFNAGSGSGTAWSAHAAGCRRTPAARSSR